MLWTISLVVGLSTSQKIGLAGVGLAFVAFALISSFVLPRRNPDFPGSRLGPYIALCVLFFVAMIAAVLYFDREPSEASTAASTTATVAGTTSPAGTTTTPIATNSTTSTSATTSTTAGTPSTQGDAAAGKTVFASAGCGGCHTLKAAGSSGNVGPNLDQLKPPLDKIVHQVEVGGGPMPAFKGQLTDKQIQDVSAFVYTSTH